ncbi:hypothetical protein OS493_031611 [Desmophyllum pertusum]|uniref:Uncharacterized protein n=1 Tax=Desmophyllum pertusum TaxID=174260 RepID=A0A9W9YL20_9CNID|nr:hypothetical protein OS493_031611 [Desmophyllum pertusum]
MRVEVFLQSAAIKILRQKLSQVSFSAGFPFRFKMVQVLISSLCYLVLLAVLALFAFLVRLIGTTPDPEPDPRTQTKQENLSQPTSTSEDIQEQNSELEDDQEPETNPIPSTQVNSEAKPDAAILQPAPPSVKAIKAASSSLSPLTLFLLGDATRIRESSSNKWAVAKMQNHYKCTRPRTSFLSSRAEDVERFYHPVESNYVPQVRSLEGLSSDRADSVVVDIYPLPDAFLTKEMALIASHCL